MNSITMTRCFQGKAALRSIFWLLAVAGFAWATEAAAVTDKAHKGKARPGADIFEGTNVVRIEITIPESGMRALRQTDWGRRVVRQRPKARATVVEGGRTYSHVSVHLKGAAGSFRPVDNLPGLTLNFDKHVKGQNFHGLEKISLNNSVQDPSYISEKIGRELFEKAGIPVPRSDYAVVTLNGRLLGLYVLVEGYNKQFLKQHFDDPDGNLYDGGFCQEITEHLNVNSGNNPEDQSDLRALAAAAQSAREKNNLSELSKALDVERFITMIAMEITLCHWDGYAMNRNNYRVFSDQESGRMVFLPHGMDQLFGVGGMGSPHTPIQPHMNGLVARAVLGTSEGRGRYLARLRELRTNVFNVEAITARVQEIEARIQPVLAEMRRGSAARHRSVVNMMCRNIEIRGENLDQQLSSPPKELKFGSDGTAPLDGWKPRNQQTGARFEAMTGPDGSQLLFIGADPGRAAASWRTRVVLGSGMYRFEGRARTKGLEGPGRGAVLRVSGAQQIQPMQGESEWVQCRFDFELEEAVADIELVCELRGNSGGVWFDAGSLKLRRLN